MKIHRTVAKLSLGSIGQTIYSLDLRVAILQRHLTTIVLIFARYGPYMESTQFDPCYLEKCGKVTYPSNHQDWRWDMKT